MEGFLYVREPQSTTPEKLWVELKGFKVYFFQDREKAEGYDRFILLLDIDHLDAGAENAPGFALVMEGEDAGQYVMEAESVEEKRQWVEKLGGTFSITQQTKDKQRLKALEEERLRLEAEERRRQEEEARKKREEERRIRREERARKRQEREKRRRGQAERELEDIKERERAKMREEATARAEKAVEAIMHPVHILKYIFHSGPKKPHDRYMALSPDRRNIMWGSSPEKLSRGLAVQDICAVMDGLGTTCLKDNVADPRMAELCFSIVTTDRTLDAQCDNKNTRAMWVLAADYLRFGLANILKDKHPKVPSLEEVLERLRVSDPPSSSESDSDSEDEVSGSGSSAPPPPPPSVPSS